MTVQTTTVQASPLVRGVVTSRKLDRAKAKYNRLYAQYKAHGNEGSRLALIAALEKMRDIERSLR